ncbi:VOC family protein [Cellulophaga lytica]|uniref:Glyoxalase/bleomycin resistance protein/dioxygenase n=1 Tax=Cellulophaga lytica (strain ATCC 23178 / DSM 7489 / JCM 8516 / NBRC 14961 / NCIMB 1423 / VKM B-1433 / Cy l20) TaxID=867900 RepID=F0RE75_CELLC|nr:VOC family protein [Cellulophaga lytica]ADY28837.1 glyoxalase/bleomycin resistance protein/dioxygenase [Cellulophaga lytica DSM 7489]AIM59881.1 glyoxalase [Cellulophaga lytica]WQG76986.1 glyoxalase/bleomycin resistance/dioxygenase family protein [Cellulophaga lytica]
MKLGAFSISLSVKDIKTSKAFYEKLGFSVFAGEIDKKYLILKNENTIIGLFEGMFDKNMLTFNPGWDQNANTLKNYDDIRDIQKQLIASGLELSSKADENTTGPANLVIVDPDGNPILLDQHV